MNINKNNFKIIALEVLADCDKTHYKLLTPNQIYYFYTDYKIEGNNVKFPKKDLDLYSVSKYSDNNLRISISALVGKNGSGKSTIIELLIKAINNIAFMIKEKNSSISHEIKLVEGINLNIYYLINNTIYKLNISDKNFIIEKYDEKSIGFVKDNEFKLENFFYTEVINYSLYAYNSNQEGSWIIDIFHKNDGYQTPIVLNPMRNEGNIDINKENYLVFQRLLANLLTYDNKDELHLSLGDNLQAESITLKLKNDTDENGLNYYEKKSKESWGIELSSFDEEDKNRLINKLITTLSEKNQSISNEIDKDIIELSKQYILYKLISICKKYERYIKLNIDFNKDITSWESSFSMLKEDKSHITFKLRQTLNFLIHNHIEYSHSESENKLSVEKFAEKIKDLANTEKIINFLPPPIFEVDIEMKSTKSGEDKIKFSSLSSGEKQQIHSINSIFYHLINLESISKDEGRMSYEYINIILEEIELYFHPEYQRTYIYKLIQGIEKLNLKKIKGINFIFVTHSPFILSDIPKQNVLFLGNNECEGKTFAANISKMFSNSFFMTDLIGEFAKNRINQLLEKLNQQKEEYRKEEEDKKKTNKKEEDKYKAQIIISDNEKPEALEFIKLIDEPILKYKLNEMFCEAYPNFCKENEKKIRENELKALAEQYGFKIEIKK
ncbi:hypothetical protein AB4865_10785 [Capnocytophaga sp. ARDL2]|uniref:hypothetical protein n=1 Tax=Capnocytophaga sp. ARDL2 TaxID=3238809 RepID=UPI003558FD92